MHIEYETKVDLSRQLQNLEKKVNYIQKNDKLKQAPYYQIEITQIIETP